MPHYRLWHGLSGDGKPHYIRLGNGLEQVPAIMVHQLPFTSRPQAALYRVLRPCSDPGCRGESQILEKGRGSAAIEIEVESLLDNESEEEKRGCHMRLSDIWMLSRELGLRPTPASRDTGVW